jgi:hypothetical protein
VMDGKVCHLSCFNEFESMVKDLELLSMDDDIYE